MASKKEYDEQLAVLTPAYVLIKPRGPFILPLAQATQVISAMAGAVVVKYEYDKKAYTPMAPESYDPSLGMEPISLKQFAEIMLSSD